MITTIKYALIAALLVLAGLFSLTWYSLARMEVSTLAICAEGEGGILIPSDVCHLYLKNFRLKPEDIASLEREGGLDVILNGNSHRKYHIAELLIHNGLDIDSPNIYSRNRLTPLQSAVLYQDLERVKFLVQHNASVRAVNPNTNLSALDMALQTAEESPSAENTEILKYLSQTDQ